MDAALPKVTDVRVISTPSHSNGYRAGDTIVIVVVFSKPVRVVGEPALTLDIRNGGAPPRDFTVRSAPYLDSSGTNTLSFSYVVGEGDEDPNGITVVSSPRDGLGEGTVKYLSDEVDVDAFHDFEGLSNIAHQKHMVDGRPPRVDSVEVVSRPNDGATYRAGERIE